MKNIHAQKRNPWHFVAWCVAFACLLPACFPPPITCQLQTLDVTYDYSTTCSSVAAAKSGRLTWRINADITTPRDAEANLLQQLQQQGFNAAELVLEWSPSRTCGSVKDTASAERIERLVLEPQPEGTSGVTQLLVCRPTGQPSPPLTQDMLLACSRGNSKNIACTIQLKHTQ